MRIFSVVVFNFFAVFASLAFAGNGCNKASSLTRAIFECASGLYEKVDKKLDEQYSIALDSLSSLNKVSLVEVERVWLKYRDAHCNNIYESISPGEEAGIERAACLTSLTASRLTELIYLETGVSSDGFYSSVSFVSNLSLRSRDDMILYIEGLKSTLEAVEYFNENCELMGVVHSEDGRLCRARMKFQSM